MNKDVKVRISDRELELLVFLYDEVEGKLEYDARFDTECGVCGGDIEEEEPLYFTADKTKMCSDCFEAMKNLLNNLIEEARK